MVSTQIVVTSIHAVTNDTTLRCLDLREHPAKFLSIHYIAYTFQVLLAGGRSQQSFSTKPFSFFGLEQSYLKYFAVSLPAMGCICFLQWLLLHISTETSAAKLLLFISLHHSSLRLTGFKPVVGFFTR